MSLKEIVLNEWNDSGDVIMMRSFLDKVRMHTGDRIYDATILRTVRRLRQDMDINYIVINNKRSIYQKIS